MRPLALLAVLATLLVGCGSDDGISAELGARCDTTGDCASLCLPPSAETPGGFCTRSCARHDDCPGNARCVEVATGFVCLFTCRDDADCDFLDAPGLDEWICDTRPGVEDDSYAVCVGQP